MNTRYVTWYDFDNDTQILTFTDAVVEPDGVMYIISTQMMHFKDKIVKEKLIEIGWTPPLLVVCLGLILRRKLNWTLKQLL